MQARENLVIDATSNSSELQCWDLAVFVPFLASEIELKEQYARARARTAKSPQKSF
jgi:hypothetical protein